MSKAWSFSAIKLFETCPRKYHAEKVLKLYPFQETEHTRYGTEVHKALEDYVLLGTPLAEGYQKFKRIVDVFVKMPGRKCCELQMAVNKDKVPVPFLSKDVWVRGIADLVVVKENKAFVVDYKTGSAKYPDKKQLELMALLVFKHFPDITHVKAALVFLLHNVVVKAEYKRDDEDKLWEKWEEKSTLLSAAFEHNNWPPKPNGLCRKWCPVAHCEFQGE